MDIKLSLKTPNRKPALWFISVDGGPVLTTFMADPEKGLASCLRRAAEAVERENQASVEHSLRGQGGLDWRPGAMTRPFAGYKPALISVPGTTMSRNCRRMCAASARRSGTGRTASLRRSAWRCRKCGSGKTRCRNGRACLSRRQDEFPASSNCREPDSKWIHHSCSASFSAASPRRCSCSSSRPACR